MDLFEPNKTQNDYGARAGKKSTGVAKLNDNSYVPFGLTKAQYEKIRSDEVSKKAANYDRNVKKAFKFQDYTEVRVLLCFCYKYGLQILGDIRACFSSRLLLYAISNHPVLLFLHK